MRLAHETIDNNECRHWFRGVAYQGRIGDASPIASKEVSEWYAHQTCYADSKTFICVAFAFAPVVCYKDLPCVMPKSELLHVLCSSNR